MVMVCSDLTDVVIWRGERRGVQLPLKEDAAVSRAIEFPRNDVQCYIAQESQVLPTNADSARVLWRNLWLKGGDQSVEQLKNGGTRQRTRTAEEQEEVEREQLKK